MYQFNILILLWNAYLCITCIHALGMMLQVNMNKSLPSYTP